MKKDNLLFFAITIGVALLFPVSGMTQGPAISWSKVYGGDRSQQAESVRPTPDGGFIAAGYTMSTPSGDVSERIGNKYADYWVVKLNDTGRLEWEKVYGGTQEDFAMSVQPVKTGGYIVVGKSSSDNGDISQNFGSWDVWVAKLDDTGRLEWDRSFGNYDQDEGLFVSETADSGYILTGTINTYQTNPAIGHGGNDAIVVKLDKTGNVQWEKYYGGSDYEVGISIRQTSDGGYALAAVTSSSDGDVSKNQGDGDYWLVKLNDTGRIEWEKSVGGSGADALTGMALSADDGYVLSGWTRSDNGDVIRKTPLRTMWDEDIWVVKIDKTGKNIVWAKAFGGTEQEQAQDIQTTSDGGFIITGYSNSTDLDLPGNYANGGSTDGYIFKIDANGNSEWHKNLGGTSQDMLHSCYPLPDGGYITAGQAGSSDMDVPVHPSGGGENLWVVRLEAPAMDSIKVTTQANAPATITTQGATLQLAAAIYPRVLPQDATWSIVAGTGTATINASGLVTAQTDGTVWGKAVAVANPAVADSIEITISGQTEDPNTVQHLSSRNASVNIYPNPAGNVVNVQMAGDHPQLTLSVWNIDGKIVSRLEIAANALKVPVQVNLHNLAAGIYMIRLDGIDFHTSSTIAK